MSLIKYEHVTKEYGEHFKALDDVSFSIDAGEFVFLIGPSGAGKSTLISLLIREILPSSGNIYFDGQSISDISGDQIHALRRRIGVVFQDFKLLDSRTVFDNVAIALEVVNMSDQDISNIVPNVLSMVGLSDKALHYPRQLSGGEKQRVSIARALAHEPDVLVADEPTGMIDPDSASDVMEILNNINGLGTTVLMATHNEGIVNRLNKRVLRLDRGKLVSDTPKGSYER